MFLAFLAVLLTDVDHWKYLSDDTDAQLFSISGGGRLVTEMDDRWVEVPVIHDPIVRTRFEKKKNLLR